MPGDSDYACFCGDEFSTRDDLISHNVSVHGMDEAASRQAVDDKYPQ